MEQIGLQGVMDLTGFDTGMKQYLNAVNEANSQTEKAAGGIGGAFASIGSSVTGVMGGLVVGAMSQAASAVAGFLPGAINAASDLNETVSKVGVVFGKNSEQVLDWAKNAASAMGQSQSQALAAAGTFGNLFVSMGLGTPKAAQMSEGLVQLAGDLASFNNMDPTAVLEKLRAGVTGETEPLKSLGVNLSAAAVKAKAMQMGLATAKGELSASAKAQATYALILEQTKTAQGDFARTSDGFANGQRIIAAQFADITATIGNAFLPIVVKLTGAFAGFLSGIAPRITTFFENLGTVIQGFVSGFPEKIPWEKIVPISWMPTIQTIEGLFHGFLDVITDLSKGAVGLDYPWEDVFPSWLANIAYAVSNAIKFVIDNLAAFEGAIAGVGAVLAAAGIYSALTGIAAAIAAINLPIVAIIGAAALLGAAWAGDWGGIQEIVIPIIQSIIGWLQQMQYVVEAFASGDVADINWENVAPAWLVPALQQISLVLDGAFRAISDFANGLGGFNYDWSKVFPPDIAALAQGVSDAIKGVIDAFAPLSQAIATNGAGALQELQNFVTGNQTSFDNVKAIWNGALDTVGGIFSSLADTVTQNLPGFMEALGGYAAAAVDWLGDAAGKVADAIGPWANALVSSLGEHLPDWIAGFVDFAAKMVSWIGDAIPKAITALGDFIVGIVNYIGGDGESELESTGPGMAAAMIGWVVTDLIPKVAPAIGRFLVALVEAIGSILGALGIAALKIGAAIIGALAKTDWGQQGAKILTGIVAGISAIGSIVSTGVKTATDAIARAFTGVDWKATGAAVLTALVAGLSAIGSIVTTGVKTVTDAIATAFTGVDWKTTGATVLNAVAEGISAIGSTVATAVKKVTDATTTAFTGLDWKATGIKILATVLEGLVTIGATVATAVKTVTDAAVKAFTGVDWKATGAAVLSAVMAGLSAIGTTVATAVKTVTDAISSGFNSIDWKGIGTAIIDGIIGGLDSAYQKLKDKIAGLADVIPDWAKGPLGIESPSKVFAEIGRNLIEGLMLGIDQRVGALRNQLRALSTEIANFGPSGALMEWSRALDAARRPLADYENAFSNIISLGKTWSDANPMLPQNIGANLRAMDKLNQGLDTRVKLLDIIKENNFNPEMILGLGGGNIADATPLQLAQAIQRSASALASLTAQRIRQEQDELQRTWQLRGAMAAYNAQLERASDLGDHAMNFFQKIEFSQLTDQFSELGRQLQEAQSVYTQTGDTGALTRLNDLISQRAGILAQMQALQNNVQTDTVKRDALQSVLNQQKQMLDQASTFGYDLAQTYDQYFKNTDQLSSGALRAMARLQDQLDQSALEQTMKEIASKVFLGGLDLNTGISGVASAFGSMYATTVLDPILDKLHNVVLLENERNAAIAEYNQALQVTKGLQDKQNNLDFLQAQLDLVSKATGAGLSLGSIFQGITLGPGATITNMLTASNRLMDALIKKSQEQLTPQALALQDKQTQLANLKSQLDLYNQAKDAGLDLKTIFAGITLGINATTADILTATTRLTDALIGQVKDDLKIHSPSRVMMDIGANIVRGLGAGMQKAFASPLMSASTVASGPVSSRALTINMGGVNNYTPMDDQLFEAKIQRVVERAFRGG